MCHVFLHLKGTTDIKSTLEYLMTLFPRKLFNDALPQIVLKHQLYSIHHDKTLVDKELVWLFRIRNSIYPSNGENAS